MPPIILKDKRFIALFALVLVAAVLLSVFPSYDANSIKLQKKKFARPSLMNWSTRTYSPEPPLTDNRSCAYSTLNVIVLIDRNEEIADRDARDTNIPAYDNVTQQYVPTFTDLDGDGVDDSNSAVVKYTTEKSIKRGYAHTMFVTSYESVARNTKVNFFTFAVATNVVPQYEVDPSGPAGTFTPALNTIDWNGDGYAESAPVTEITNPDVGHIDSLNSIADIYFKKSTDPASKSTSPTDIARGYGTTTSPDGVGRTNWANAYAFAANMVSARYNTPGDQDDIDIVLGFWGTNPDQNNGYNQKKDILGSNDYGIFSATSASFGHGGLNNTNSFLSLPPTMSTRSVRYKPSRESDIWMAANVVEALRTGNPVAELGNDDAGYTAPPGLIQSRNGVQVDTFLGGRFPTYDPANKVFGPGRYLTAPDFRKQFTGYRENGWRLELCDGAPPGGPGYINKPIIEDMSVEVNGLEGAPLGEGESRTVTITVRNNTRQIDRPELLQTEFQLNVSGCTLIGAAGVLTIGSGVPEVTFNCTVDSSIGSGSSSLTVTATIPASSVNAVHASSPPGVDTAPIVEMTADATDSETTSIIPVSYPA